MNRNKYNVEINVNDKKSNQNYPTISVEECSKTCYQKK